jgi:hypothetical protein
MMHFRFSIRDLLWLMLVIALFLGMGIAWERDARRRQGEQNKLIKQYLESEANMLKTIKSLEAQRAQANK